MNAALRKTSDPLAPRPKRRPEGLRGEMLKLFGFALLFAAVMVVTAWMSGGLAIVGQ